MKHQRAKICHCCGRYTEPQPQDPNRDTGYGTCGTCKADIEARNAQKWQTLLALVANSLNDSNRNKFLSEHIAIQHHICQELIKEGIISWKIS